jgi:hypothetical protein
MSKGHRDNHAARLNRGPAAFQKKAERRCPKTRCNLCGNPCRASKLVGGLCPYCLEGKPKPKEKP